MATLAQIRDGVKATLETAIPSLKVHARMPGTTSGAVVIVEPNTADYTVAMGRGSDTWELTLWVLVPAGDWEIAQLELDQYIDGGGSHSIRAAIFANRTLGIANTDAHVSSMTDYGGKYEASVGGRRAEFDCIGAQLTLTVHTKPS